MPEQTQYYLGKRRRRRGKGRAGAFFLLKLLLILLLIGGLLLFWANSRLFPLIEELAEDGAIREMEALMAKALEAELDRSPAMAYGLVTLTYKQDGTVASLETNTAKILALRTKLLLSVIRGLSPSSLAVEIPYSAITGLNFLGDEQGMTVKIRMSKDISADFYSVFTEQGINQTRHSLVFTLRIGVSLLIPSHTVYTEVEEQYVLSETLLLGAVPDAYTKIHRLTDDITESELDDIYDFGASAD